MVTSYGQGLHKDFYSEIGRMLQDCSGQGTTWGPGIGELRVRQSLFCTRGGSGVLIFLTPHVTYVVNYIYKGPPPDGCGGSGPSDGDSRGGGGTSGQVTSTACAVTSGTCATDGSSNSGAIRDLTYSTTTAKFTGTIITNQCIDHERIIQGGGSAPGNNDVSCIEQTIPTVTGSTASDIPTLGRAAMTISGGVNIYSAFEAGFNDCAIDGMPCACDEASCDAGLDVGACEVRLGETKKLYYLILTRRFVPRRSSSGPPAPLLHQ